MAKAPRYLFDGMREQMYVRAWKEGQGRGQEIIVQCWKSGKPEGEPDEDWAMPAVLGLEVSISQAMINAKQAAVDGKD